jgi:hypothetical protein
VTGQVVVCHQRTVKSALEPDRVPERIVVVIVVRALRFFEVFVLKIAVLRLVAHEVIGALLDGRPFSSPASS